jgi:hypothetical protein
MFYIGVDGEMSHNNVEEDAALLQLGVAVKTPNGVMQSYNTIMRPEGEYRWDETAANVHGFSREEVDNWDVSTSDADNNIFEWLVSQGCKPSKRVDNVGVGFSVGSFDMLFVKKFLPKTFSVFSRRFLDLNALVHMLTIIERRQFMDVKKDIMEETVTKIGYNQAHDAGWDAIMHIVFMETVLEKIQLKQ